MQKNAKDISFLIIFSLTQLLSIFSVPVSVRGHDLWIMINMLLCWLTGFWWSSTLYAPSSYLNNLSKFCTPELLWFVSRSIAILGWSSRKVFIFFRQICVFVPILEKYIYFFFFLKVECKIRQV